MSFHILHILTPGCRMGTDHGMLACRFPDGTENRIALEDVRAVIIAAPGIQFSSAVIAKLLAQDSILLHCDERYQPIGWTTPLARVVREKAFMHQCEANQQFEEALWHEVVKQKVLNQLFVLESLRVSHELYPLTQKNPIDEGNIARRYWPRFFGAVGSETLKREYQLSEDFTNSALNYGYAVLSALIHRSILVHGLLPQLGIHHKERYRNIPLVYDLMEPFRPLIDKLLADALFKTPSLTFRQWVGFAANALRELRIKSEHLPHTCKLMDAVDIYVNRVTQAYIDYDLDRLWLPDVRDSYWHRESAA